MAMGQRPAARGPPRGRRGGHPLAGHRTVEAVLASMDRSRLRWPLILAGLGLAAWAVRAAAEVDLERPNQVVLGGPYGFSRNPMYVALDPRLRGDRPGGQCRLVAAAAAGCAAGD